MKKLTILFISIFTFISLGIQSQTQNSVWSLPSNYRNNNGISPLPTVSPSEYGYQGDPATTASNAMQDINGDLLFFIVDGEIYDKDGYTIGDLSIEYSGILPSSIKIKGSSEVAVIPVPGNCSQYYIFMAGRLNYNLTSSKVPIYALLDLSEPNDIYNPGKMGKIMHCSDIQSVLPSSAPDILLDGLYGKQGLNFYAASKEVNGKRLIFFSTPIRIYRMVVDGSGLHYDGNIDFRDFSDPANDMVTNGASHVLYRGEMELVELTNGGNVKYRLAVSMPMRYKSNSRASSVYYANLDASGQLTMGANGFKDTLFSYNYNSSYPLNGQPNIHGLEFSSDGSKLYITHEVNDDYKNAFDFLDFNNISNGIQPVPGVSIKDASNYEFSQIEIGKSGNKYSLYLAYSAGLATFSNPDTPNSGVLSPNAISFTYSGNKEGISTSRESIFSYMLPDQIDGMDYSSIGYPSLYNLTSYTATSSGTWQPGQNPWNFTNSQIYVQDKLIIPSGKNIVIENMTFHFAPDAKVIVKQGGKLTLGKGGVFTNAKVSCDNSEGDFWQGVEVWGTSNQNQYPSNQPNYQGTLVLEDGGTIEYAIDGARNWKVGDYNKTGGVIQSKGGKFINNSRDVEFMSYQNFAPNNSSHKLTDLSHFTNTEFISNNDYIELSSDISRTHVTMWDVHGVLFSGCTFANNKTGSKWNSNTPYRGIHGIDASFTVKPLCTTPYTPCPSGNLQKSEFTGLNTAVEADGTGTSETVKVTQSEFHDIVKGVLIYEIDNASIDRNNIVLNDPGYNQNPSNPMLQTGIKIKNATGFTVEENDISANYSFFFSNSPFSNGIVINNSGTADNRVYKNNLNGLRIATSAFAINYEPTTAGDPSGLQFLCNNYSFNRFDIYVGNITNVDDGIRLFQGNYNNSQNARFPAGNKFSNVNSMGSWNLDNHNGTHIDYYYNTNESNAEPINTNGNYNQTTKALTTSRSTCPSSFGSGGLIFHSISLLSTKIDSLKNVYNDLQYNYLSLIDGGNTEQLQQTIDNSWSDDAWALRNQLIEKSPYLSTETLLKVADRQILPNAMLLGVLLANAEATRGSDFIDKLKEATHSSFPQYMINYVINNRDVKTTRTNLEGAMGSVKTQIALNQNIVKHKDKMRDSYDLADRQKTTEIGNSIFDRIGRADYYISQEQWSNATNAINSIKMNDTLKGQLDFIKHYEDYINFRENLGERKISQLDSSEIEQLKSWAEEKGRVAGYAQNILCFFYNTCYSDSLTVDEDASISSSNTTNSTPLNDVLYNLTISPNPASSNATISWTIYDQLQNCSYKVQNLNDGSVVAQGSITENEGSVTINVSQFQNGYYVVKISNNGKLKAERKLVIE